MSKSNVKSKVESLSDDSVVYPSLSDYRGHRHRMIHGSGVVSFIRPVNYCYTETINVPAYDKKLGRYCREKQVRLFDSISELSKYRVSDFFLENQIEAGSVNQLSPVKMINNDTSASEYHVLTALSRIDNIVDSNNNNNSN